MALFVSLFFKELDELMVNALGIEKRWVVGVEEQISPSIEALFIVC